MLRYLVPNPAWPDRGPVMIPWYRHWIGYSAIIAVASTAAAYGIPAYNRWYEEGVRVMNAAPPRVVDRLEHTITRGTTDCSGGNGTSVSCYSTPDVDHHSVYARGGGVCPDISQGAYSHAQIGAPFKCPNLYAWTDH